MRWDSLETPVGGWVTDYGVCPSTKRFNGGWAWRDVLELEIALCIKLGIMIQFLLDLTSECAVSYKSSLCSEYFKKLDFSFGLLLILTVSTMVEMSLYLAKIVQSSIVKCTLKLEQILVHVVSGLPVVQESCQWFNTMIDWQLVFWC